MSSSHLRTCARPGFGDTLCSYGGPSLWTGGRLVALWHVNVEHNNVHRCEIAPVPCVRLACARVYTVAARSVVVCAWAKGDVEPFDHSMLSTSQDLILTVVDDGAGLSIVVDHRHHQVYIVTTAALGCLPPRRFGEV